MHEIKTKGSLFAWLKYALAILLGAGVVLSSATPVLASSVQNYTSIDTVTATFTIENNSITVYPETTEYVMPIRISLSYTPSVASQTYRYLSGRTSFTYVLNQFTGNTSRYDMWYEANSIEGFNATLTNGQSFNCYFDNFHAMTQGYSFIIGYLHFTFEDNPQEWTFTFKNGTSSQYTVAGQNTYLRITDYEYGFVNAMVEAINGASSISQIYSILNSIDTDTGYIPDILAWLQLQYPHLYQLIENAWHTDQAILSVDQNIYSTVLNIFALLNNAYAPQESQANQVAEEVDEELGHLEVDLAVTLPSGVADLSDDYIAQIDTTYNASVFNMLFNPTLVLMLCICFALAILSYMLYGGK